MNIAGVHFACMCVDWAPKPGTSESIKRLDAAVPGDYYDWGLGSNARVHNSGHTAGGTWAWNATSACLLIILSQCTVMCVSRAPCMTPIFSSCRSAAPHDTARDGQRSVRDIPVTGAMTSLASSSQPKSVGARIPSTHVQTPGDWRRWVDAALA